MPRKSIAGNGSGVNIEEDDVQIIRIYHAGCLV